MISRINFTLLPYIFYENIEISFTFYYYYYSFISLRLKYMGLNNETFYSIN